MVTIRYLHRRSAWMLGYFFLKKAGAPFGMHQDTGGYQVLTPRLHYTYTPFKDQHNVPNFETKNCTA